jgi:hypothetical protein
MPISNLTIHPVLRRRQRSKPSLSVLEHFDIGRLVQGSKRSGSVREGLSLRGQSCIHVGSAYCRRRRAKSSKSCVPSMMEQAQAARAPSSGVVTSG